MKVFIVAFLLVAVVAAMLTFLAGRDIGLAFLFGTVYLWICRWIMVTNVIYEVLTSAMFLKITKIVGHAAAIIMIVAWWASGYLQTTYFRYPRSPIPEEGRTVPYKIKTIIVYLTEEERRNLPQLIWIVIGSGMVVVLVLLIERFGSKK
jgi:hypothetical protein